jgi:hypothetical protein
MRPCSAVLPLLLMLACATTAVKVELPPASRQCTSETFKQVVTADSSAAHVWYGDCN